MKVGKIRDHVCALNGDSTARSLIMSKFSLDFINWAVENVFGQIHLQGRDYPFMSGSYSIPDDIHSGLTYTAPDYPLPLDFDSAVSVNGLVGTVSYPYTLRPIEMNDSYEASQQSGFSGAVYYSEARRRWYLRTYTPSGMTMDSFTLKYRKKPPPVSDDADELPYFPPNDGWEPIVIMRAAAYAKLLVTKDGWDNDPQQAYLTLLRDRIGRLNMQTPDQARQIPLDEVQQFNLDMQGRPF
jgi:hypothetical protein